jgi:hypothetical protein
LRYEAKEMNKSAGAVNRAVKKVGSSRKRLERQLGRSECQGGGSTEVHAAQHASQNRPYGWRLRRFQ